MSICTILCDSREQKGYDFQRYNVDARTVTLATGDYTIAEFCAHDADLDTYHPRFAVERKSGNDFLSSITGDNRRRFKREIKRAADWTDPLEVVIEEPWTTFTHNLNMMQYRKITPSQVEGTVSSWGEHYNVNFHFSPGREAAEQYTYDTLIGRLRGAVLD